MPKISGFGGTFCIGNSSVRGERPGSGIRTIMTPQDLALHDAGELLPESGNILREDLETGRIVINSQECVLKTAKKAVEILD